MEKRGIQTNIGNLNREIKAANRLMQSIRQLIQNLKGWITELGEKRKELLAQKTAEEATLLPNLLMKYSDPLGRYGDEAEDKSLYVTRFLEPESLGVKLANDVLI